MKAGGGITRTCRRAFVASACVLALSPAPSVESSGGVVELESSGFLKRSTLRGDSSFVLSAGARTSFEGASLAGRVDARAVLYVDEPGSLTPDLAEAYVSTRGAKLTGHELSAGRRIWDLSELESEWSLGLFEPRFLWTPIHPERNGNTGVFYRYEAGGSRWLLMASPVSIPDLGAPVSEENGVVRGSGPWFFPLPSRGLVLGRSEVDIDYTIEKPSVGAALFRPMAAAHFRRSWSDARGSGPWISALAGWMPIHQPDLVVEPFLTTQAARAQVIVRPSFGARRLGSIEGGYRGRAWSFWGAVAADSPVYPDREIAPGMLYSPAGDALMGSLGGSLTWSRRLRLSGSVFALRELDEGVAPGGVLRGTDIDLPGRFPYRRAWKIGARWTGSKFSAGLAFTRDASEGNGLLALDSSLLPSGGGLRIGAGIDLISAATREGAIGRYHGNDRVWGRVSYEF